MKRLLLGLLILAVLLCGCLAISAAMAEIHRPIADCFGTAARLALRENWTEAAAQLERACNRWEKFRPFTAAFADHTPMDEIDALLEEVAIYAEMWENPHFSAACGRLYFLETAMAESHLLRWWNLL